MVLASHDPLGNTGRKTVALTKVVPFLVEDGLKAKGAGFSKAAGWAAYVVTDGQLITGRNPASSGPAAKVLPDHLKGGGNA